MDVLDKKLKKVIDKGKENKAKKEESKISKSNIDSMDIDKFLKRFEFVDGSGDRKPMTNKVSTLTIDSLKALAVLTDKTQGEILDFIVIKHLMSIWNSLDDTERGFILKKYPSLNKLVKGFL
jgi:hypothetical protein